MLPLEPGEIICPKKSLPLSFRERDRSKDIEEIKNLTRPNFPHRQSLSLTLHYFLLTPSKDIKVIDCHNLFCFEGAVTLLLSEPIIALDTEHYKEPSNKLKTSTLQISTLTTIFIFDLFSIIQQCEDWEGYLKQLDQLFRSEDVLKLVYEPVQDLKVLNYTTKYKYFFMLNRLLDLAEIKSLVCEKQLSIKIKGLKGLAEIFFKRTLDKEEQLSDWLKRPLDTHQLEYAALDAFVLFKLYNKVSMVYGTTFSNFSKVCELNLKHLCTKADVTLYKYKRKDEGKCIVIDEN